MKTIDTLLTGFDGEAAVFFAGMPAPRGAYVNVETGRIIRVEDESVLPASLDGRVAAYVPSPPTWRDIRNAYASDEN